MAGLKNGFQKSVLEKIASAPLKAAMSDDVSFKSALTTSTPLNLQDWALDGSRDIPRTFQPGSLE